MAKPLTRPEGYKVVARFPNGYDLQARNTFQWLQTFGFNPVWAWDTYTEGGIATEYICLPNAEAESFEITREHHKATFGQRPYDGPQDVGKMVEYVPTVRA